jgi:nitrate/sulfonate/bicarbonate ABC transporter, periplasmic nitrate/sulfonate/bicarbonate-binding protein
MKKLLLMLMAICMTSMGIIGCSQTDKTDKTSNEDNLSSKSMNITMAANPFIGMAPIYVAMDKGFFGENGINFNITNFDDSSASCTALLSDKVDIAYSTLDAAIIAESQFDENKIKVSSVVDESAGADGILVKNDINDIADIQGKTVGVSINQTSHYLLLKALEKAGLSDSDVNLVNMSSSDAGVSFISGGLDVAVTWEPYLSNAVNEGAGKMIFSSADAPGSIVDVFVVKAENKNVHWMDAFNKAYTEGLNYLSNEDTHADGIKITAKYLEVSVKETEAMYKTIKLYKPEDYAELVKTGGIVNNAVSEISKFYFDKKIINKEILPNDILK